MIKFSFIIPVYNAESTLEKCIDSIVARQAPDYEVILINDSSKDRSLEICERYAQVYPQVSVYTFPNAGAGAARNRGIELSKGNYILFCDSDDWYDPINLDLLLTAAETTLCAHDLISFDFHVAWLDRTELHKSCDDNLHFTTSEDYISFLSTSSFPKNLSYVVWNKVFKKDLILKHQIRFPERDKLGNKDDWGEDLSFLMHYIIVCNKIAMLPIAPYYNAMRTAYGKWDSRYFSYDKILHMTRMLLYVFRSPAWQIKFSPEQTAPIYTYQLHNYIYEFLHYKDISECRSMVLNDENCSFILEQFQTILSAWKTYGNSRWGVSATDYRNIIYYMATGNKFLYKIRCHVDSFKQKWL